MAMTDPLLEAALKTAVQRLVNAISAKITQLDAAKLGKTEKAVDSALLDGKTLAEVLAIPAGELAAFIANKATSAEAIAGVDDTKYITALALKAKVDAAVSALIDGAPLALDTLRELAEALGDSEDALAALTLLVDAKLGKTEQAADSAKLEGKTLQEILDLTPPNTEFLDFSTAPYNVLLTTNMDGIAALGLGVYRGMVTLTDVQPPNPKLDGFGPKGVLEVSIVDGHVAGSFAIRRRLMVPRTDVMEFIDGQFVTAVYGEFVHDAFVIPGVSSGFGSWDYVVYGTDLDATIAAVSANTADIEALALAITNSFNTASDSLEA